MPQMHTMQKLGFETAHQSAREHEWQSRGSEMSINHPLPLQLQSHRGSRPLPHSPWQMFRKPLLLYAKATVISQLDNFTNHSRSLLKYLSLLRRVKVPFGPVLKWTRQVRRHYSSGTGYCVCLPVTSPLPVLLKWQG